MKERNNEMKKKTLIIEGPNGMGKDVFINKILEYCPYYKVHYASSEIVKEVKDKPELLPLISYVTFETIFTSIQRDPTNYPHIQYRSPLSNMVYNPIFRPEMNWKLDNLYAERFFTEKYDESYVFWLMTYDSYYLRNQLENKADELSLRLRNRKTEIEHIVEINDRYVELFKMIKDLHPRCQMIHTVGTGTLDLFSLIDRRVDRIVEKFAPYIISHIDREAVINKDNEYIEWNKLSLDYDTQRYIYLTNNIDECLKNIHEWRPGIVPEDKYDIITNPYPLIFDNEFFSTYVMKQLISKNADKYKASSQS